MRKLNEVSVPPDVGAKQISLTERTAEGSADETRSPATSPTRQHPAHDCRIDSSVCEVMPLLFGLLIADAPGSLHELLPCSRCRGAERDAALLAGQKLGRHQRLAVLCASGPQERPEPLPPSETTRSARVAHSRSLRGLEAIGLLELSWCRQRDESGHNRRLRAARRTPLGQAVVDEYGDALTDGSRIRWSTSRLLSRCRLDTASLISLFEANLQEMAELRNHVSAIHRQLARHDDDDVNLTLATTDHHRFAEDNRRYLDEESARIDDDPVQR
jgi:hypothetical protein